MQSFSPVDFLGSQLIYLVDIHGESLALCSFLSLLSLRLAVMRVVVVVVMFLLLLLLLLVIFVLVLLDSCLCDELLEYEIVAFLLRRSRGLDAMLVVL